MSTTIDERVVEMRFDNKQFESNVHDSLSTLDKLKKSLNFDSQAGSLNSINDAASKTSNFNVLGSAVDSVKSKFSALEVVAITALANITNSIVNTGKQMLASLTIAPITEGFAEYELKMGSVQTIMASTGESLDTVMDKLNELNLYADKTIYSFSDMTSNIGKFTNAGVKLDDAVAAIQGVSNVAAVSGANAQEASRAMYNFAQALSAGYVKLIDWKSIEYANMATVEFKTQLMETAVEAGTLQKTADGMYKVLTKNANGSSMTQAISATQYFNESLSNQWMTTEVLTKTLAKYSDETTDIGKKAFSAAQDVKTFTQLMDTLKEAVGSGWAETYELVIGNFDEAKALFTGISDAVGGFISKVSGARNALLKEWKDLGGRTALIDGLRIAFEKIGTVASTISDAFKEVFSPITGKQLASFSERFKELASNINFSDETLSKIKSTFKGFFAVIDIVAQAVSALIEGIAKIAGIFLPDLSGGLLSVTGGFGDWLVKLDESIKKNDTFKKVIDKIVDVLSKLKEKASEAFHTLSEKANNLSLKLTGLSIPEALSAIKDKIVEIFEKIKDTFENAKAKIASTIDKIAKKLDEFSIKITGLSIHELLSEMKDKIAEAVDKIKAAFDKFDSVKTDKFASFCDTVKEKLEPLKKIFDGIKSVISFVVDQLKKAAPVFSEVFKKIGEVLGAFWEKVKTFFGDADINTFLDLIKSGVLVGIGIGIKNFIDKISNIVDNAGKIKDSVVGILDSVRGCFEQYQKNIRADILQKIAISVAILAAAIVVLSMIDTKKLAVSLGAIAVSMTELLVATKLLTNSFDPSKTKGITKTATVMVSIGIAVLLLASALKTIGDLNMTQTLQGLVAIVVLTQTLMTSMDKMSSEPKKLAIGLIAFAAAIAMLVKPVKELGSIPTDQLLAGLVAVAALCAEIILFINNTNFESIGVSAGVGLILLAEAIKILANAVGKFAELDPSGLLRGVAAIGVLLGEVSAFANLNKDASNFLETSAGLVLIGAALAIISGVMSNFGEMSWEEIGKSLIVLAGALTAITIAVNAMEGTASGAASMILMATALNLLIPAIKIFGSMPIEAVGTALLVLAGVFVVLGAAGLVLEPITPTILALSAAVALLGVGAAACGVGALALASGLSTLVSLGSAGLAMLGLAIKEIVSLLPFILKKVGEGFVALLQTIGDAAPELAKAFVQIISAILDSLLETVPKIVLVFVELLENILVTLAEHLPEIIEAGMQIILAFLEGIASHVQEIVELFIQIIINITEGIANKLPDLVQSGIDLIISFIDGIAEGIANNAERMRDAILNLLESIVESVLVFLGIHSPSTKFLDIGINMIKGLINGIDEMITKAVDKIKEFLSSIVGAITEKLSKFVEKGKEIMTKLKEGISNKFNEVKDKVSNVVSNCVTAIKDKVNEFKEKGKDLMDKLKTGISNGTSMTKEATALVITKAMDAIKEKVSKWTNIGKDLIEGLKKGISEAATKVVNAAKKVVTDAIDGAKKLLGIHSPSKVFAEIGENTDKGMIIGLLSMADKVSDASKQVGKRAIDGVSSAVSKAYDTFNSDLNLEPTIRPVIDLSDVNSGIGRIDDMLSSRRSIVLAGDVGYSINKSAAEKNTIDSGSSASGGISNSNAIYNTFNVSGDNPSDIAEEISRILQRQIERRDASWA